MNDQTLSVIRWTITLAGGYLANRGIISNSDLSTLTSEVMAAIGPLMILGTFVWGIYAHSRDAKIASVNAIKGVKVVPEESPEPAVSTVPKNGGIVMGFPPPPSAEK